MIAVTYMIVSLNSDHSTSDAATHKSDLANLAQSDPEFYQFLLSEDQELLDFSEDDLSDDLNQSDTADDLNYSDDEEAITSVMFTTYLSSAYCCCLDTKKEYGHTTDG